MGGRVWGQSVQFSRSVVSNSLRPHELQHPRPPCPSPTPESTQTHVHWVSDTIQPSHPLSSPSPVLSLSQHQGLFKWVSFLHQWGRMDTWICMPEFLHYSPEITSLIDCTQIQNKKVKKKKKRRRDFTLPTKVHLVKAMIFPVVMYGCQSWTREKAECQRIDAFKLWCWRRLFWDSRGQQRDQTCQS